MSWSPQQDAALKTVREWVKAPGKKQVFRLFGYAGTGKTTLAKALAGDVSKAVFGAYTGKASMVLATKGCSGATTIHKMIYRSEQDGHGTVRFVLNRDGPAAQADLIVIDEASMVDEELGQALLSFRKPVLVLGDPAQLPPVKGAGFFTDHEPDIMLTEVHRQAADSPIIHLATKVREGGRLSLGRFGDSSIIRRDEVTGGMALQADKILVGLNKTRTAFNTRVRTLRKISSPDPVAGDELICLKNCHPEGLFNGGGFSVLNVHAIENDDISMQVKSSDFPDGAAKDVITHRAFFQGTEAEMPWEERQDYREFTFGYALTCHKSQGSQWPHVLLFDESRTFRESQGRWLYTAITRAAERITIVQM